jgi:hypothetical protein
MVFSRDYNHTSLVVRSNKRWRSFFQASCSLGMKRERIQEEPIARTTRARQESRSWSSSGPDRPVSVTRQDLIKACSEFSSKYILFAVAFRARVSHSGYTSDSLLYHLYRISCRDDSLPAKSKTRFHETLRPFTTDFSKIERPHHPHKYSKITWTVCATPIKVELK